MLGKEGKRCIRTCKRERRIQDISSHLSRNVLDSIILHLVNDEGITSQPRCLDLFPILRDGDSHI